MELTEKEVAKVTKYITMYGNTDDIIGNPSLRDFIDEAASSVSQRYFGDKVYKAIALLAMHNVTVSIDLTKGGASGDAVASKSIGPVSITYRKGHASNEYSSTRYGRMYDDLVRSRGGGISVTGIGGRCI